MQMLCLLTIRTCGPASLLSNDCTPKYKKKQSHASMLYQWYCPKTETRGNIFTTPLNKPIFAYMTTMCLSNQCISYVENLGTKLCKHGISGLGRGAFELERGNFA